MRHYAAFFMVLLLIASSCSVRRRIPKGETIYKGANIHVTRDSLTTTSTSSLKSTLKLAVKPTRNKFLFGQPYKVWWWYVIGEPKRETGFRTFLRKSLAEAPVFGSSINPTSTAEN